MKLNDTLKNLNTNFGLINDSPWCGEFNDILIDGIHYDELYHVTLDFDLQKLFTQNENDTSNPKYQALTDTFTNEHREAAHQVIDKEPVFMSYHRYPPEYRECFQRDYQKAVSHMLANLNTRRAIMNFSGHPDNETQPCLTSVQFTCRNNRLNVNANFRSWELEEWAKFDLQLIYQMTWEFYVDVRSSLNLSVEEFNLGFLTVNTPSAHVKL